MNSDEVWRGVNFRDAVVAVRTNEEEAAPPYGPIPGAGAINAFKMLKCGRRKRILAPEPMISSPASPTD